MLKFIAEPFQKIKAGWKSLAILIKQASALPTYRVVSIEKDDNDDFIAEIQLINRRQTFRMRPEEILANDRLTDSFSQRDIRTLTYLGYLGLNSPKYQILAKRLSEKDSKLIFAIKERGKPKTIIKTANEISSNEELLKGMHQEDAHMIGYITATEQVITEQKQKQQLLASLDQSTTQRKGLDQT